MPVPCCNHKELNLREIADLISARLVNLYRKNQQGLIPAYRADHPMQFDPNWKNLHLFYEYFHGDSGQGLGAAHQTGWTGLIANLLMRQYRQETPLYWQKQLHK